MKTTTTVYSVGDRVKVKPGKGHDAMTMDKAGKIVEISTPALGIQFDGMDMVHKWFADDEVQKALVSTNRRSTLMRNANGQ